MLSQKVLTVNSSGNTLETLLSNISQKYDDLYGTSGEVKLRGSNNLSSNLSRLGFYTEDGSTIQGFVGKSPLDVGTTEVQLKNNLGIVALVDSAGNNLKLGPTITYNNNPIAVESDSGWLSPTLVNSYLSGINAIQYRKIGNWGLIFGSVRRAAGPGAIQTICTIPAGYRPDKSLQINIMWGYDNLASQITTLGLGTNGVLSTGFLYTLAGTASGAGGSNQLMFIYRIGG